MSTAPIQARRQKVRTALRECLRHNYGSTVYIHSSRLCDNYAACTSVSPESASAALRAFAAGDDEFDIERANASSQRVVWRVRYKGGDEA